MAKTKRIKEVNDVQFESRLPASLLIRAHIAYYKLMRSKPLLLRNYWYNWNLWTLKFKRTQLFRAVKYCDVKIHSTIKSCCRSSSAISSRRGINWFYLWERKTKTYLKLYLRSLTLFSAIIIEEKNHPPVIEFSSFWLFFPDAAFNLKKA